MLDSAAWVWYEVAKRIAPIARNDIISRRSRYTLPRDDNHRPGVRPMSDSYQNASRGSSLRCPIKPCSTSPHYFARAVTRSQVSTGQHAAK